MTPPERDPSIARGADSDPSSSKQAQGRFLANMSHELRTPIHGILSFAEFGLREAETATREDLRQYFQQIHESGSTLLAVLGHVIELAKLEAATMDLELEALDLGALASTLADESDSGSSNPNVSLELEVPDSPVWVNGDEQRLAQAVRHLLASARRWARNRVTLGIVERPGESVEMFLRDDREALDAGALAAYFDIHRASSGATPGGMDLGPSIAREIVTAHGGTVTVLATAGHTEVRLRLPQSLAEAPPSARAA